MLFKQLLAHQLQPFLVVTNKPLIKHYIEQINHIIMPSSKMLKIVAVLGLLLVVSAEDEMLAPPAAAVVSVSFNFHNCILSNIKWELN